MSFPSLPPIPADPELLDLAEGDAGFDYVDRRALQWALLGKMPMVEGGELVQGQPPRGDYAGMGEGCVMEPEERASAPVVAQRESDLAEDRVVAGECSVRRVAPPLSRRLTPAPRSESARREPRFRGMWVFLSSAAASVLVLLLSSLAVAQYGNRAEEPMMTPPVRLPGEAVADSPAPERPPGLAAAGREER